MTSGKSLFKGFFTEKKEKKKLRVKMPNVYYREKHNKIKRRSNN